MTPLLYRALLCHNAILTPDIHHRRDSHSSLSHSYSSRATSSALIKNHPTRLVDDEDPRCCSYWLNGRARHIVIRQEAQPVLNKNLQSTVVANIKMSTGQKPPTIRYIPQTTSKMIRRALPIEKELAQLRPLPWNFRRMVINLDIQPQGNLFAELIDHELKDWFNDSQTRVRSQLYQLIAQLQISNIRQLHLHVKLNPQDALYARRMNLDEILRPLRQLGTKVHLELTGVDDGLKMDLLDNMSLKYNLIGTTALWRWYLVKREVQALAKLIDMVGVKGTGVEGLLTTFLSAVVELRPAGTFRNGHSRISYKQAEEDWVAAAKNAENELRTGKWKDLKEEAEAVLEARGQ